MILHNITLVNNDNWDEEDIDVGNNSNESNYQSIETTSEGERLRSEVKK
jgi:hypothetical protein